MSNYDELIGILKELLFNRFLPEPKIIKGLLGDGTGVVRVPGRKDFNYARFNRGSTESFEVFNKTVPEVNDWPILISELPWQPGLTQVVGTDWESYIQSGWGDSVSTSNPHAPTHVWRDGYIGSDPLDIYMRAIAPGRAYSSSSTGSVVFVNSFEYGTGTIWPGVPGVDLSPLMSSIPTGTARFAGVYVNPVSNSLGVVTGNTSVDTQAFDPPLVTFPFGTIPIARIRLYGGQGGLLENDFRDARRLFDVPATGTSSSISDGWKLGNTIVVSSSGDGDYTSVQSAIDAASSGDTVLIDKGTYTEEITVNKSLSIIGLDNTKTIITSDQETTLDITATNVTLRSLAVKNTSTGTTGRCVRTNSNVTILDNCFLEKTGAATTGIGLHIIGGTNSLIRNCTIHVINDTTRYGVLADTAASDTTVLQGLIRTFLGDADIRTNHASAILRLAMPTLISFDQAAGTIIGQFVDFANGNITLVGNASYFDQQQISTPSTPSTNRWKLFAKSDGYYQLDDAGAETKLGGVTDAQYYVAALHAGLSAEIVPSLDTFKVSKLAASDGSPDPAWSVGATGILTTNSERLDMDGKYIILDADADTSFGADIDDQITWLINSGQVMLFNANGIEMSSGKDIKLGGDEAGAKQRLIDTFQSSITDHWDDTSFDPLGNWTWASYTGFVTPANLDASTHPSIAVIYNSAAQGAARAFAYRASASDSIFARIGANLNTRIGLRIDDGTNDNYFEWFLEVGNVAAAPVIKYRYANASVVTGPTTVLTFDLIEFITLHIAKGGSITGYYQLNTPRRNTGFSIASWFTTARSGIYYELVSGTPSLDRSGFIDWYKQ